MLRARPASSPAAPYRHFRDREALLADVAREGFARFEAMLSTGWNGGKTRRDHCLPQMLAAPISPSRAPSPPTTRQCFESGLPPDLNPEMRAAGDKAFAVLRTAATCWSACCRPASGRRR